MNALRLPTRRDVARGLAASAASLALPCPSFAQGAARVVVIGGGFGGAGCARALRQVDPKLQVTLIEPKTFYFACPFSNEAIAGLREFEAQQFRYDRIAAEGVTVVAQTAVKVDAHARTVGLADGTSLGYDRLVLSPGIGLRFDALPGYDEAAATKMPHAWIAGEQTLLLRRQLEAMDDGGTVVLAVPAAPLRCPPAPYERASLIAHYLKTKKPRSKILILDAKDGFSQQRLFEQAWKELYPDMIERIALSQGGRVTSVEPATNGIVTDFGNYTADVANVIPPQKAGRIAEIAGAADLRRCRGEPACGQVPGAAAVNRRLLQHGGARLCLFAVRRLRAERRIVQRGRRRRHQPARCAARGPRARSGNRADVVHSDHGGYLWLARPFNYLARGSRLQCSPCPALPWRRHCSPMSSQATPLQPR